MHERPPRLKFWSVSRYDQWFLRYKLTENQKCTECFQTELEHLTVKSTLYALNTYHRDPNFGPFCSTTSRSRDTIKAIKNWKCTERPQIKLEHLTVKGTLYILNTWHRGQKIWSVSPYDQQFSRYKVANKRPRGPDALLGHLLVKRMLVMKDT